MIMYNYELYENQNISGKIAIDLDRIKSIFNYYNKPILYRVDKYFIEFIFSEIDFNRSNMIYFDKIFERVVNNIRISKNKNGKLIVVIARFPSIFINE